MAVELNCEFANFYCAMAYPGSQLYSTAVREQWPLPARWSGYSQHSEQTFPLPTQCLPPADVLRFRDEAFQSFFTGRKYLSMIERKFGPDTVRHIKDMTSQKLVRQYA